MSEWLQTRMLRALRVPPQPEPPAGAPGSAQVFRAGKNYYWLRLGGWSVTQALGVAGILFSFWFLARLQAELARGPEAPRPGSAQVAAPAEDRPKSRSRSGPRAVALRATQSMPPWARTALSGWGWPLIMLFEVAGVIFFFAQLAVTFVALRLDWEQRWYIVTDRSLRLRHGLWEVQELTMSFANLQHVAVSQGPVQRLLGLADVRVQSAGGGGGVEHGHGAGDSLHTGVFHSVENAHQIRDLIVDRLRRFRETGLGDPDEKPLSAFTPPAESSTALAAAHELLAEARELRRVLS